jgi:hypothetical protein
MKVILKFPPALEDHTVPEGPSLGVILLATSGFDLITPFADAGDFGGPLGGGTVPRSFVTQGSAGIPACRLGASNARDAYLRVARWALRRGSRSTATRGTNLPCC